MPQTINAQIAAIADDLEAASTQLCRDASAATEAAGNYTVKATERTLIALYIVESVGDSLASAARALRALTTSDIEAPATGPTTPPSAG